MKNFRNIALFNNSLVLLEDIYLLVKHEPRFVYSGLPDDMITNALTIRSHIADGSMRYDDEVFKRFLELALKASYQLEAQLIRYRHLKGSDTGDIQQVIINLKTLKKQLLALVQLIEVTMHKPLAFSA